MKYYSVTRNVTSADGIAKSTRISPAFDTEADAHEWKSKNGPSGDCSITEVERSTYGIFDAQMAELTAWSKDEAVAAEDRWRKEKMSGVSPLKQWSVLKNHLPECHKKWDAGDSKALFTAVALCGSAGLPLPRWCTSPIFKASSQVNRYEEKSWDNVFGLPHKKGSKLFNLRNQQENKMSAVLYVYDLIERDPPVPVGKAIESAANEHAISTKLMEKWFYGL